MSSSSENTYIALYLYTAVIEFIYFTIHLQISGHKNVIDIAKHLKFFKPEVTEFINTFSGKDIAEKCSNMLCTATPIFCSINRNVSLSKDYKYFKQIIYEDFLISKSVDLILKGICDIQEICEILNLNYVIKVDKDALKAIFKQYPYFYLDKKSVFVIQFHSLLGFHDYTYEKVVQYFLSLLQNTYVMNYNDVKFHSQYVPSCCIRSYLITFCILNTSNIFKCRNSQICIVKKPKQMHFTSQTLSIKTLNEKQPLSVNLLVYQSHGYKLRNCTGEIYELFKNSGLIICVVDLEDNSQKTFLIYFHKTALKCLNEMKNLSEYLNVRDVVQFDAHFNNVGKRGKCWQASRVTVLKSCKQKLYHFNIDPESYTLNILQSYYLNPILKYFSRIKCPFNFRTSQKSLTKEHSIFTETKSFKDITDGTYSFLYDDEQLKSDKHSNEYELTDCKNLNNYIHTSSHSTNDFSDISSCFPTSFDHKSSSLTMDTKIFRTEKSELNCLLGKKLPNGILKSCIKDNELNSNSGHLDKTEDSFIRDNKIENCITSQYTFLFGEVETIASDGGIIICSYENKSVNVYFQNKSLFYYDSTNRSDLISKCNKMLVAIPYFHENDIYHVAIFVYLLNKEEIVYLAEEQSSAKDFVANYFVPKVKKMYSDMKCYCDISNNFKFDSALELNSGKFEKITLKCSDFLKSLKRICIFNEKTFKHLLNLMVFAQKKTLMIKRPKTYLYMSYLLTLIFPVLTKHQFHKQKTFYEILIKKNKFRSLSYLKKPAVCDSISSGYSSNKTYIFKVNEPECKFLKKSKSQTDLLTNKQCKNFLQVKEMHDSCSSLGSYFSCRSASSCDNVYYSCESAVNMSDIDLDINDYNDPQLINLPNVTPASDNTYPLPKQDVKVFQTTKNISSEINNSVISNFTFKNTSSSNEMSVLNTGSKPKKLIFSKYRFRKEILSLRSIPNLKPYFIKNYKLILWRPTKICKYCSNESIETTAYISAISNKCIFLNLKDNHNAFLSIPKSIIPERLQSNLKLNSTLKIILIPNIILNFSHVLTIYIGHPN